MAIAWIHYTTTLPGIAICDGGSDYFARTRWAISETLLDSTLGRDGSNYCERPIIFVDVTPTPLDPIVMRTDPIWWGNLREVQRYIYVVLEWTHDLSTPWRESNGSRHCYIINHDPIANAGPDQVITLDPAGTVLSDIVLHGTASSDPDSGYPDHVGPIQFSWSSETAPLGADPDGIIGVAASNLPDDSQSLFLSAGTIIPPEDRGMYTFRLTVKDNEIATTGIRMGLPGENSSTTRVYLQATPPELCIISPCKDMPFIINREDCIGDILYIPIAYSLGSVEDNPLYGGAWIVRLTIRQSMPCPFGGSPPAGTIIYRAEKVSPNPIDSFTWDGVIADGGSWNGLRALGSFTVELELLDRLGQSVTQIGDPGEGYSSSETDAIAIDRYRWCLPVNIPFSFARMTATFMEFPGHSDLHGGIDIGPLRTLNNSPDFPTDVIAVASGLYECIPNSLYNKMKIKHTFTEATTYLHCAGQLNQPTNSLVVQGTKLHNMGNAGPPNSNYPIHLNFEYESLDFGALVKTNPLTILNIRDDPWLPTPNNGPCVQHPIIEEVHLRRAQSAGQPATLGAMKNNIAGPMDIIVKCRDRAHPWAVSPNGFVPFGVKIADDRGTFSSKIEFWALLPGYDSITMYYALENNNQPYLFYLRGIAPNWRQQLYACNPDNPPLGCLVTYHVEVYDFARRNNPTTVDVIVGAESRLVNVPPDPAFGGNNNAFQIGVEVISRMKNVAGVSENLHIELLYAPSGWSIACAASADPGRTGVLVTNSPTATDLIIDSGGNKPSGTYRMAVVLYSDILDGVYTLIPLTVRIP